MSVRLVDTHCHLDAGELVALGLDAVVERAMRAGVKRIVVPAIDPSNFDAVRALAVRFEGVHFALGVHPLRIDACDERALDALDAALSQARDDPKLVAVGEIGLDFFVPGFDAVRQERFYQAQLEIARAHGLPVLLHVRRSQDRLLKYLRMIPVPGGIAHAFNGSRQQAERFIGLGFALGFGGAMVWERARNIRRLATGLPLEAIVLETDAPDIPPPWLGSGEPNQPAEVARIAAGLAGLRGLGIEEIAAATSANAERVMPRLRPATG
ncbi:MAG: TatD family hydrolase [Pseudomonadota bacterium]|nr:TatD family hydrolase [Pseudomonadota bacterium]